MVYPGIDQISQHLVFRSLGDSEHRQRIGCGFMHKPGIRVDEKNFRSSGYALVYVIRGRGEYVCADGTVHALKPGSLFHRHPGVIHSTLLDPAGRWAECFLDMGPDLYRALTVLRVIHPEEAVSWLPPDTGLEQEFYSFMRALENAPERELPHMGVEIIQLCASVLQRVRAEDKDPLWHMVEKSCRDFSRSVSERMDLREYCRVNGWGYESFRKAFVKRMGISPGRYIIQRRMDEACRMLRSGKQSVKETADALGYRSPYEFSAQFRRVTGWSPGRYRGARIDLSGYGADGE